MQRASIVMFGGTDATLAVASAARSVDVEIAAVVTLGEAFRISYSTREVTNARYADVGKWCAQAGVPAIPYTSYDDVFSSVDLSEVSLAVVAGWYNMVPIRVRDRFPLGAVGFHASLLPKLRGGAPLNWAILSGLRRTGVTLFALGDGVDDGPVYGQHAFAIGARDRVGQLVERANAACAELVRRHLPGILSGRAKPRIQKGAATYGLQRRPEDGAIDWRRSAVEIDRLVRATSRPYPGAYADLDGERFYLWETALFKRPPALLGAPGQIARVPGLDVPCIVTGDGVLAVVEATDAGGASLIERLMASAQKRLALP